MPIGPVDRHILDHKALEVLQAHCCCSNDQPCILCTQTHSCDFSPVSSNQVGMPVVRENLIDSSDLQCNQSLAENLIPRDNNNQDHIFLLAHEADSHHRKSQGYTWSYCENLVCRSALECIVLHLALIHCLLLGSKTQHCKC